MVESVARHGFAGTTLRELVALAGVSRTTFYTHFENKQDCFLSTFDEIVAQVTGQVKSAIRSQNDARGQLIGGLAAIMDLVVEEPDSASLVAVESLTLGAGGVAHRQRASKEFEAMIRRNFECFAPSKRVSDATIRAIVAGIQGVIYRRLRAGRRELLPGEVEELVDWGLGYLGPDSAAVRRAVRAAAAPIAADVEATTRAQSEAVARWLEPPDSPGSRSTLSQRERILRAAAKVVREQGYEALSIPAISAAAGVSNQTFYENFSSKREAFLAAFEIISREALSVPAAIFDAAGGWPEAIGVGLRVVLEQIAANELFGRLAFFELATAGPVALDKVDAIVDRGTSVLEPGVLRDSPGGALPPTILEAIGSGIWFSIQHELAHDRAESLPELAPEFAKIALAPFDST
jgi:AcrR family transcriptional regulator